MKILSQIQNFLKTKVFPVIINFFKSLSFKDWLLLLTAVLLLIFFLRCRYLNNKLLSNEHTYNTEITEYKNKLGEVYKSQQLAILDKDELKKQNNELSDELKKLKDNPLIITKVDTEFKVDTLVMESEKIVEKYIVQEDSVKVYDLHWNYNKEPEYFTICGTTLVHNDFSEFTTTLNNLTVNSQMTMDVIDDGKNLQVITKSNNPYVNVTGMQSVMIDPRNSKTLKKYFKQKRWGIGPSIGVGVDKDLKFTPYIGVSLNYNVFSF